MKLGIRSIRYVPITSCADFGILPPGSAINPGSVFSNDLVTLPFTPETADLREEWRFDGGGRRSSVTFAGEIRAQKEQHRATLNALTGRRCIFLVDTIDGQTYIIGSPSFPPTFTWSDSVSGISKSAFAIKIACDSLHGVLFAAS